MKSEFQNDLSKEILLGQHLDVLYDAIFQYSRYQVKRIHELDLQHEGVDLVLQNTKSIFYVDEKAQLDYLNKSLPTFAFELSYLKNNQWRQGWLLDEQKKTDIYFLITNIYPKDGKNLESGLSKIKITGIYRKRLIAFLAQKGLTVERLESIEKEIRANKKHGKIVLKELDARKEGVFFFSKTNKKEEPINLVLKLKCLVEREVGKVLYE